MKDRKNIKLKTYDDIFNVIESLPENDIKFIDINMLTDFRDHPYKVLDNQDMEELLISIKENGILMPVLVRPIGEKYEIISGHRRKHCARKAGLEQVPCVIKDMSYDEAVLAMIDSNIQRKNILPSEKAFVYKMKLNSIRRQGERTDLTSRQNGDMSEDLTLRQNDDKSADLVGKEFNDSGRKVQRYIRLTELTPFLLNAIDIKKLTLGAGINLSYLTKQEQTFVENIIKDMGFYPTVNQTNVLKMKSGDLTEEYIKLAILDNTGNKNKIGTKHRKFSNDKGFDVEKIQKYFPANYSLKDIEEEIIKLLEEKV